MWRLCLTLIFALLTATLSAQTRSVWAVWDLAPDHLVTDTWELEADGVTVPCVDVQVSQIDRRCRAQVPANASVYRLRGVRVVDGVALSGDWSGSGVPGETPGAFTVIALTALEPGSEPEPMPVGVSTLAAAITTSNPAVTGSLTWTAGSRGYAVVAVASSGDPGAENVSIAGWTIVGEQLYATRRRIYLLRSDSTPSNGTLSISYDGINYQETIYGVIEATGIDGTTPNDAAQVAQGAGTSLTLADVGTIDAGDLVLTAAAHEGASNGLALTGHTPLVSLQTGTNVRALIIGWQTGDDTPTSTNNGGGNGTGMVALILNAAAGGGGQTAEGSLQVAPATLAASVTIGRSAAGALTVPAATLAATAAMTRSASGDLGVPASTLSADAEVTRIVSGALGIPASTLVAAVSGGGKTAVGTLEIAGLTLTAGADIARSASGALASPPVTLAAGVTRTVQASGALVAPAMELTAIASIVRLASGDLALAVPVLNATAAGEQLTASAALLLPAPALDASALVARSASGALTVTAPVLDGDTVRTVEVQGVLILEGPSLEAQAAIARLASGDLDVPPAQLAAQAFAGAIQSVIGLTATVTRIGIVKATVTQIGTVAATVTRIGTTGSVH